MTFSPQRGAPQATLVEASRRAYAQRAEVALRLKHTNVDLERLLTQYSKTMPALGSMTVRKLVRSLPTIGPVRATAIIEATGLDPMARIRVLSKQQIRDLLDQLGY